MCFSIRHLFMLIKINCCMTNPCYIRKVKSKETWLNATNSNQITWSLNQSGEEGPVCSQHQSKVIFPTPLLLAANKPTPKIPQLPSEPKQGWPRRGSTWQLNGTADLRCSWCSQCKDSTQDFTLNMYLCMHGSGGTVTPNGDPAPENSWILSDSS